jgi:hypothetical protein
VYAMFMVVRERHTLCHVTLRSLNVSLEEMSEVKRRGNRTFLVSLKGKVRVICIKQVYWAAYQKKNPTGTVTSDTVNHVVGLDPHWPSPSQDARRTLRFIKSCLTGLKIDIALKLSAYIPDGNSLCMVSRGVRLLFNTVLISDAWSQLGSNLYSEQNFVHWYLSEDVFPETREHLGAFDETLERVRIGSVKG